jgi:hypothetical protein
MTYLTAAFADRSDMAFRRVAVIVQNRQHIGGVTSEDTLYTRKQPWRDVVDDTRMVGEDESYALSSLLWQMGGGDEGSIFPAGPSTAFGLEGALLGARDLTNRWQADAHRGPDGWLHVASPAMDMPMRYRAEYEQKAEKGILTLPSNDNIWDEPAFD